MAVKSSPLAALVFNVLIIFVYRSLCFMLNENDQQLTAALGGWVVKG